MKITTIIIPLIILCLALLSSCKSLETSMPYGSSYIEDSLFNQRGEVLPMGNIAQ